MFVFSIKTGKKQLLTTAICAGAVVLIAVLALALPTPKPAVSGIPVVSTKAATGAERTSFLKNLGYEAEEQTVQVREIVLPDESDETIKQYNQLQKQMGFDLEAYLGKRVKVYTYRLLNHQDRNAQAHLYVYRDVIIGGHIATDEGDESLI